MLANLKDAILLVAEVVHLIKIIINNKIEKLLPGLTLNSELPTFHATVLIITLIFQ